MKRLLLLLLLLPCLSKAQQLVYCNTGNQIVCTPSSVPHFPPLGDQAPAAFGKINANFLNIPIDAGSYCLNVVNTTSDATPCLQTAANAASAANRPLHIPGGTYYIRTRWNCPANGIVMYGDGWNINNLGQGTWFHIVSSQFVSGGAQQGNHPFQCGTSASVNQIVVNDIAFYDDELADGGGWTPSVYAQGAMWIFSNGSAFPTFVHVGFFGINQAIDFHSVGGYVVKDSYFQVYSYAVWIEHSGNWSSFINNVIDDTYCNTTNCPNITAYIQANATGLQSNRNDNPVIDGNSFFGLKIGIAFGTDASGVSTNVRLSNLDCDKCLQVVNITAAGTNGMISGVRGHPFNFAGNAYLRGSSIFSESGGTAHWTIVNLRCQNAGDACVSLTGTGDDIQLTGPTFFQWGGNSTANGTCDATVYAVAAGSGNTVRIVGDPGAFSGSCSSLTYQQSSTVMASIGQCSSWTPVLNFGGTNTGWTASAAGGQVCINDQSFDAQLLFQSNAAGSSTGAATLTGIPVVTHNCGTWCKSSIGICTITNSTGLTGTVIATMATNSSTIQLFSQGATGLSALTNSNFSGGTALVECRITGYQ